MKSFLLSVLCLFTLSLNAQDAAAPKPKKKLTPKEVIDSTARAELKLKLKAIEDLIDKKHKEDDDIKILNQELQNKDLDSTTRAQKTDKLEKLLASTKKDDSTIIAKCGEFKEHKDFLKKYGNISQSLLDEFSDRSCRLYGPAPKKSIDYSKFIVIGDNDPVAAEDLFSNENTKKVLADVFSIDSKTNLGTFEIPGDNAFVNFYLENNDDSGNLLKNTNYAKDEDSYALSVKQMKTKDTITPISSEQQLRFIGTVPEGALFKSIQIELREGGIVDTRLVLQSVDGKFEFYFEGIAPVSILNYTRRVKKSFLRFSHYVSLDGKGVYNENALKHLLVRYTEVLDYHPNAGSNYVPDDISYKFPSEKEATMTDRRSYQVINKNHLQHVLDIRTYTDLLGLFGDEANGLFQIEGKADFFIHPFNHKRSAFYYFKKVSPYVRYSRFDDDNDFLQTDSVVTNMEAEYFLNNKKLGLLERSNLEMGLDINLMNFRFSKELPFWMSVYSPLSYNVTKVRTKATVDSNDANFKTLGFGLGADIEIRRFNNFGLNLGYELKGYSFIGDYSEFNVSEPGYLKTQAVKAEVFYYPGLDKSNSIFLRMKSIRDISSGQDSFFQLQVGYRFTLGIGAVKAR